MLLYTTHDDPWPQADRLAAQAYNMWIYGTPYFFGTGDITFLSVLYAFPKTWMFSSSTSSGTIYPPQSVAIFRGLDHGAVHI